MHSPSARGTAIAQPLECSWRLRPTNFLTQGYFRKTSGPITVSFARLDLSPYEKIELWAPNEATSTAAVNQLAAFQTERRAVTAASIAENAAVSAPGTAATIALQRDAERAQELAEQTAAKLEFTVDRTYGTYDTVMSDASTWQNNPGSLSQSATPSDAGTPAGVSAGSTSSFPGATASQSASSATEQGEPTQRLFMIAQFDGGKYPGSAAPAPVSSVASELLVVYRSSPPYLSSKVAWADLAAAIERADLVTAVRVFAAAAASHLRGFYMQDLRRVLHALAIRAVARTPSLRRQLFPGPSGAHATSGEGAASAAAGRDEHGYATEQSMAASGFGNVIDGAITTVAQQERRCAHDD